MGNRPIKPDIVMEAGNTAPAGGLENPEAQGLSILTLNSTTRGSGSLLRRTYKTSPAAAAASNALAQIATAHPQLRPATWRALLVNTARWPEAAVAQMPDRRDRLRAFGYGVPDLAKAASSASNRPVMVYEGALQPNRGTRKKADRQADFIELPLPEVELESLGAGMVELSVTLSYFIEPTDSLSRQAYPGARLRWDLQGPAETPEGFRARINKIVKDEGVSPGPGSYPWVISDQERSRGTLQQGYVSIPATNVAGPRLLAVYPVTGWWEDSLQSLSKKVPYSVVVTLDLGENDVELYALVAQALVGVPLTLG